MEIETFIKNLKLLVKGEDYNYIEIYIFGSALRSDKFRDIDILIIYAEVDNLKRLKKKIMTKFYNNLIHIISLTKTEEIELAFISKVGAIKI